MDVQPDQTRRPRPDGPAVVVLGGDVDPPLTRALSARLARLGARAVLCPEAAGDGVPEAEAWRAVVGLVRAEAAAAVVWVVDGDAAPVHVLGRRLAALGMRDLPVVAVPAGTGDDDLAAHERARQVVSSVVRRVDERPSVRSGRVLVGEAELRAEVERDARMSETGRPRAAVAVIDIAERDALRRRLGGAAAEEALQVVARVVVDAAVHTELAARDARGRVLLLVADRDDLWVEHRLGELSARLSALEPEVAGETVHLTPVVGWARSEPGLRPAALVERAVVAHDAAGDELDLRPRAWHPGMEPEGERAARRRAPRRRRRTTATLQLALTVLLGVVLPFVGLVVADRLGHPVADVVFAVVVVFMGVTTLSLWLEGLASLRRPRLPARPDGPAPRMSAVVAAYLPNEAATVVETLRSVLASDHADLQVVLAYNRPHRLPVEDLLEDLARSDPRLLLLCVEGSTSKAQNVNAALAHVTGEVVGVFDADHHPAPDAFDRAWRWIADGADVVQGRCVVRNGDASLTARLVAVEFEAIYGVSHPGRSRLHGFAVFGGSNGYWRTSVLRRVRLRSTMLTEDIDSSVRLISGGGRIVYDAGLLSHELAPTSPGALWWQRLRWAQGWFQVTRRHAGAVGDAAGLTRRQRTGMFYLLRWREMAPWVGQLGLPLALHALWRVGGDVSQVPVTTLLVLAVLVPLSTAPAQTFFAWLGATPELRRRPLWFVGYLLAGMLFYTEFRNAVARVAHVRELTGAHDWIVTPRSGRALPAPAARRAA
ncbi:glycosyltransferase family 2 protein [Arthrobacter sp. NEB 688]|uniref:glycosyltransferase family 2 protein n=1 Tax=Arthrobacter sp. NEB 688 TaxID=904039 RepID=UPI0015640934|nr:glycosyltransferase family 2 protein [Arthrobacter sp. NEB 688]QKE83638.1 glycosyltransferase family 2 protein [Arthrobacter sp. NEB 688]